MTDQKAIREIRCGSVRATIRQHTLEEGDTMHYVSFRSRYKEFGVWYETTSFGLTDLPAVALVAEMALAWIYAQPRVRGPQTAEH